MCVCPHPTWQSLRREEEMRIADNCQMLMIKACHIKQKRFEAVIGAKGASTKYWAKAVNTYVHVILFLFL